MRIAPISDARALRRLRTDPDAICVLYDRHVAHLVADLARVSRDREIRTVRFEGFLGEVIERRVGEGGVLRSGSGGSDLSRRGLDVDIHRSRHRRQ
jgi:hypothetical protein